MSYEHFSSYYDLLMEHVEYEEWLRYMERIFLEHNVNVDHVLDLGCGTGELLLLMDQKGWQVTGVDLSEEMLSIAQSKLQMAGVTPQLYQGDMSELPPLGLFDVITIFCDSLNYLDDEEAVKRTFASCYKQLKPGGMLLFDVHSPAKIKAFDGAVFADASKDVSYIWTSFAGEKPLSIEHELTFFALTKNGYYERVEELHKERTFESGIYKSWLEDAGFSLVEITADFLTKQPTDESERLFFACRKIDAG
ncbi:class I SAM-dependent DNA methyltransferase [Shouchella patagoniensis]|uniref:class I SAM-dependent DNA methyltransferase n=1 Tax=Shouchella patagoniensis TaxID=228576 RepID=UPI0009958A74|nr:class I SAM-dependent methyltransferase [Shouchella patagoniensis]